MPIETTIEQAEFSLAAPPTADSTLAGWFRPGWVLGRLVLTGLLVTYLVGWVHDFQRIRRLEAEPTPPSKVITKNEAWQRIYSHPARWVARPRAAPVPRTP
jgi:hypothetical protein